MSLVDLLKHALLDLKASWVMWILLALSVVDLVIIGERSLFLFRVRDDVGKLSDNFTSELSDSINGLPSRMMELLMGTLTPWTSL